MTSQDEQVLSAADGAAAQLAVTLVTASRDGYRAMRLAWTQAVVDAQTPDHPLHGVDLVDVLWWCSRLTNLALRGWQDDRPDREDVAGEFLAGVALGYTLATQDGV